MLIYVIIITLYLRIKLFVYVYPGIIVLEYLYPCVYNTGTHNNMCSAGIILWRWLHKIYVRNAIIRCITKGGN